MSAVDFLLSTRGAGPKMSNTAGEVSEIEHIVETATPRRSQISHASHGMSLAWRVQVDQKILEKDIVLQSFSSCLHATAAREVPLLLLWVGPARVLA